MGTDDSTNKDNKDKPKKNAATLVEASATDANGLTKKEETSTATEKDSTTPEDSKVKDNKDKPKKTEATEGATTDDSTNKDNKDKPKKNAATLVEASATDANGLTKKEETSTATEK